MAEPILQPGWLIVVHPRDTRNVSGVAACGVLGKVRAVSTHGIRYTNVETDGTFTGDETYLAWTEIGSMSIATDESQHGAFIKAWFEELASAARRRAHWMASLVDTEDPTP